MTITALPTRPVLDGRLADRVVFPSDPAWDEARGAFNLRVDQQPVAIVQPLEESDVIAAVRYARAHGLRIAPQSTGHNAGPLGPLHDDTIIVDVSGLDEVAIDADALRVRVGAGVRWEQVVPALSELGLAALHGSSPDVGIAGYSLGGGMGWLARKHGLQTNSVTAFELVTADGHLVRADAVHEPDLFWALRGGGGNFGVVTAIEFAGLSVRRAVCRRVLLPVRAHARGAARLA
ncbi:MAG: FAD-dependent oxidoreductase [Solirubrobacteraceae bacterium]